MAETAQAPMTSIKSRIAALNLEEVHAPSPNAKPTYNYEQAIAKKKAPPPPPPAKRPQVQQRVQTINNPPVLSNSNLSVRQPGNLPRGPSPAPPSPLPELPPRPPPRTNSNAAPSLPPRKSSEQSIKRRESSESVCTVTSNGSAKTATSVASNGAPLYHIRAPPFDPSKVPPVFPRRTPAEPRESATRKAMKSNITKIPNRAAPPVLPTRPALPARNVSQPEEKTSRTEILPPPAPKRSALSFGLNKATEVPPPIPTARPNASPPPVPLASRPNLDAILASKPKPGAAPASCLICRDFSAPDQHAAKFPRLNLPGCDIAWLAQQLTAPFPSLTDKARAIFTWLHHNIDYDTHSFLGGTVQSTDQSAGGVLNSGLAVCAGYAGLFAALALKAGLQAVVVSGHGKGYGHVGDLKPGAPIPPREKDNHAWNAVQIDNGQWKLIDACWGAGHLDPATRGYKRAFAPERFTQDNDEFGLDHYPADDAYFLRSDGRAKITWEEYMGADGVGERVFTCEHGCQMNGLGRRTFQPVGKFIRVYDPSQPAVLRFSFGTACAHWDHERNGKGRPMVHVLNIGGRDGRKTEMVPFQTDGRVWWLDVNRADLGAPGQKVSVSAITSFDNRDGRGLGVEQFKAKKGRCAMAWQSVAHWELI